MMLLSTFFSLSTLCTTLFILSAPFCVLQLALCKYCKGKLAPMLPLIVSIFGMTVGFLTVMEYSDWYALSGILILFPSLLGFIGSGLGWAVWRYAQTHFY